MSRISDVFAELKQQNKTALVLYVTAGDPEPGVTVELMHALVDAGADVVELGVPFSDPMAEGPTIQKAMERALGHNVGIHDVLAMVTEFRQRNSHTPVVLMGYLNPIEYIGYQVFAEQARKAGVDGILTVDMPPEEGGAYTEAIRQAGLDTIFLAAPTTTDSRIEKIAKASSGFVYYVSVKGVTGVKTVDVQSVADNLTRIRQYTDRPVGVGFGIRDAESAAAVAKVADAVVVGSALVNKIAENPGDFATAKQEIVNLIKSMRQAMDKV